MENNELKEKNEKNISAMNKLLVEMVKNQKAANKNLVKVFIATIICYTVLLAAMIVGFFVYESQFEVLDTQYETYEFDQEVDGEGEINNINGDLYKDNATHNDNGGSEE